MRAALPENENERLEELRSYAIVDTEPEAEYDDITLLAAHICGTPMALINLVEEHRQWAKSHYGTDDVEVPREYAFCSHAILEKEILVVEDATRDPRFSTNPLVSGETGMRFYAGAPLVSPDGYALGSLCVVDIKPHRLTGAQKAALEALSRQVVAQMNLRRNFADLRRAQEELSWKTAFLEAQVHSSPDGILVIDQEGRTILQNQKSIDMMAIPPEIADGPDHRKQLEWVAARTNDPEAFIENTLYLSAHPNVVHHDEITFNDGMTQERHSSPVVGQDGTHYGRIWTFRNITDRKKAEAALRESQLRHRLLFENMLEGYFYSRLLYREGEAYDYLFLAVNQAFEQLTDLHDVVGKAASVVSPAIHAERPDFLERYARVARTGIPEQYETYVESLGRWFSVSVYSHEPEHFSAVLDDITDRKERETILRESDEKFHQLADHVSDGFWIRSPDFKKVHYISPAFERIWGRTRAELSGALKEFIHPDDLARVGAAFLELTRDQASLDLEHRILRPDGEVRWVRVQAFQVRDAAGQLIRQTGVVTDVTEKKLVADELNFERDLLRTLLEHCPDHIYFKDRESRILKSSNAQARQIGVSSAQEMVGKTDFDYFTDEHAVTAFQEEQEIIRTGIPLIGRIEKETFRTGQRASWALTTKMPLRNTEGEIIGTFGISKDITELKDAEARLVNERARFQHIFDSIPVGVALCRHFPDGRNERIINDAHLEICGLTRDQDALPGIYSRLTDPEDAAAHAELYRQFEAGATDRISLEKRYNKLDGTTAWVVLFLQRHTYSDGVYDHLTTVVNITKRKSLEIQLLQSQKMETVGKLAGGIAHEFNSILTAIIGQSELLLGQLPGSSPMIKNATEIIQASGRAATLTRQLLAFGSKQLLRPETLNLNRVLASMHGVLQHLMGHTIEVRIVAFADLLPVRVDLGQMEQAIMNLAINAHDAMPGGGVFTLETANVSFPVANASATSEIPPGEYVLLTITDTGEGMTPEVKARAFEPFFTTKDVGQGTGLGLSTCYGIIKQSGGYITLLSEPDEGATFKIYLPQMEATAKATPPRNSTNLPTGNETILLLEEDSAMREMVSTLLRKLGYTVHGAAGPMEVLSLHRQLEGDRGALLITASTLPQMSGRELAARIQVLSPGIRVLYTSPHAAPPALTADQGPGAGFLQKPFTPAGLATRIRQLLDAPVP